MDKIEAEELLDKVLESHGIRKRWTPEGKAAILDAIAKAWSKGGHNKNNDRSNFH